MKLEREIEFVVDGIDGQLKVITGPFRCKVYQDGQLLEGEKHIYKVKTSNGGSNGQLKIVRWFDNTVIAIFCEKKKKLDPSLTFREYLVGGLPLLLFPIACFCGFTGLFREFLSHIAGGYLVGLLGGLITISALVFNYTYIRIHKEPMKQLQFGCCTLLISAITIAVLFSVLGCILP